MTHLDYKGWRSSRIQLGVIAAMAVSAGYAFADVTSAQWIDFLKWDLGFYIGSEVLTKGAIALTDRSAQTINNG